MANDAVQMLLTRLGITPRTYSFLFAEIPRLSIDCQRNKLNVLKSLHRVKQATWKISF